MISHARLRELISQLLWHAVERKPVIPIVEIEEETPVRPSPQKLATMYYRVCDKFFVTKLVRQFYSSFCSQSKSGTFNNVRCVFIL